MIKPIIKLILLIIMCVAIYWISYYIGMLMLPLINKIKLPLIGLLGILTAVSIFIASK